MISFIEHVVVSLSSRGLVRVIFIVVSLTHSLRRLLLMQHCLLLRHLIIVNLLNFLSLITVSKPVVEVIPKLLQNVHVVADSGSWSSWSKVVADSRLLALQTDWTLA